LSGVASAMDRDLLGSNLPFERDPKASSARELG
jgi:hypothetical protein